MPGIYIYCYAYTVFDHPIACLVVQQLLELYSLMKEVTLVIQSCQSASAPSAPTALLRIVALLDLLDPSKPLLLQAPEHYFVLPKKKGQAPSPKKARVRKQPGELTELARITRQKLRAAIFKRFGYKRYGKRYKEESHLFDMVVAFNPAMRELGYIDRLAASPGLSQKVKDKIWLQIAQVAEKVIISKRTEEKMVSDAVGGERYRTTDQDGEAGGSVDTSRNQRLKMGPEISEVVMANYESAGLFDKPADNPAGASERALRSPLEEAEELLKDWREAQVCTHFTSPPRKSSRP